MSVVSMGEVFEENKRLRAENEEVIRLNTSLSEQRSELIFENKTLRTQLAALEIEANNWCHKYNLALEKNEMSKECLEFYADSSNWYCFEEKLFRKFDQITADDLERIDGNRPAGGKRAREALTKTEKAGEK